MSRAPSDYICMTALLQTRMWLSTALELFVLVGLSFCCLTGIEGSPGLGHGRHNVRASATQTDSV